MTWLRSGASGFSCTIQLKSLVGDKLIGCITGLRSKLKRQRTFSKLAEAGLHSVVILSMLLPNLSPLFVTARGAESLHDESLYDESLNEAPAVELQMLKRTTLILTAGSSLIVLYLILSIHKTGIVMLMFKTIPCATSIRVGMSTAILKSVGI